MVILMHLILEKSYPHSYYQNPNNSTFVVSTVKSRLIRWMFLSHMFKQSVVRMASMVAYRTNLWCEIRGIKVGFVYWPYVGFEVFFPKKGSVAAVVIASKALRGIAVAFWNVSFQIFLKSKRQGAFMTKIDIHISNFIHMIRNKILITAFHSSVRKVKVCVRALKAWLGHALAYGRCVDISSRLSWDVVCYPYIPSHLHQSHCWN